MIRLQDALDIVYESLSHTKRSTKSVPIEDALFFINAKSIKATLPLPPFDNSAMDGYGVCGEFERYKVVGKIFAGKTTDQISLDEGEALRIFTGAKVPPSVDTVIPQERVEVDSEDIKVLQPLTLGANIRKCGEDVALDEVILDEGELINSSHIALLASQGISKVEVYTKVKVAVFASGSELRVIGEELREGEIYNSNAPYLIARAKELGCECDFLGKCGDSIESLIDLIKEAKDYDLIITSGGVSVGEADFTKEAFGKLGMKTLFSKVAVKPGKPTTFGVLKNSYVLNLPGNPLACALNFEIFGKMIIKKLSQTNQPYQDFIKTKTDQEIRVKRGVSTIMPGLFDKEYFTPFKDYSPGSVNTLNHCNGMIIVDENKEFVKKDDVVKFIPIRWDLLSKSRVDFIS